MAKKVERQIQQQLVEHVGPRNVMRFLNAKWMNLCLNKGTQMAGVHSEYIPSFTNTYIPKCILMVILLRILIMGTKPYNC